MLMFAYKFISIGTKGTSIPTELNILEPPLVVGLNSIRWAGRGMNPLGFKAHAWVSKLIEPFELFPIEQALREGRVRKVDDATWSVGGKQYRGQAFLPTAWKSGQDVPQYVAVIASGWPHGRVEGKMVRDKNGPRNADVVAKLQLPSQSKPVTNPPTTHQTPSSRKWTRDALLVALNLYHKLTFGQLHARQPAIVSLAEKFEQSSENLAIKLCHFASLDPALELRGIKGLEGASALDRAVWNEFHGDLNEAVPASEDALRKLFGVDQNSELEVLPREGIRVRKRPTGPTETRVNMKLRRGQDYFRDAVLNNFGGRCGITQLAVRELLIASHILPWGTCVSERLNVRNGLSLSRLHDAAFDQGLIAFDDSYRLMVSPRLKAELPQRAVAENFGAYVGQSLCLPDDAALPELTFLAKHCAKKFRKT